MTRPEGYQDPAYLERVRGLPCIVFAQQVVPDAASREMVFAPHKGCQGRVEAHHAGWDHAKGKKAPDDTAIPLCTRHHREWHGGTGPFKGWGRAWRRAWADAAIERTREVVAVQGGPGEVPW